MAQKYMKELESASFYVHDVPCCPKAKEKYCIYQANLHCVSGLVTRCAACYSDCFPSVLSHLSALPVSRIEPWLCPKKSEALKRFVSASSSSLSTKWK